MRGKLLSALTNDNRFEEAPELAEKEGREKKTMCKILDEVEEKGVKRGTGANNRV
ncbi:MAG: hypothetical protein ILP10_04925 [Lachnospiraceae bacterium]|nr:hypothetical protein [Lachnospiraceae bacterium]